MRYPFESREAQLLNTQIFETIYYAALEASCELAAEFGPYETYDGSPVSKGVSRLMSYIHPTSVEFFLRRMPILILDGVKFRLISPLM